MKKLLILAIALFGLITSSHWLFGYTASKAYDFSGHGVSRLLWNISKTAPFSNDLAITYNIGNTYYQQAEYAEAIDQYSQVIRSDDLLLVCPALYNWAQSLLVLGDEDLAEPNIESAVAKYAKALSLVSRQSCVLTEEFNQPFIQLAEDIQNKLASAANQEPDSGDQEEEQPSSPERDIDEQLEEELENIEDEVEQLQRADNDDRSDETRDNDSIDVVW